MHRGFLDLNTITLAVLKKNELVIQRNGELLRATRCRSIPARLRRQRRNATTLKRNAKQCNTTFFHEADFSSFITMHARGLNTA